MQPKLAVDRSDLGRPDQPRMRDGDRVQRPFKGLQPEIEELVERRKGRAEIVILPDIGLQEPGMIRPPIENIRCRQPIALKLLTKDLLLAKILRHHSALHPAIGNGFRDSLLQASLQVKKPVYFQGTSSIQTRLLTKQPVRTVRLRYA